VFFISTKFSLSEQLGNNRVRFEIHLTYCKSVWVTSKNSLIYNYNIYNFMKVNRCISTTTNTFVLSVLSQNHQIILIIKLL